MQLTNICHCRSFQRDLHPLLIFAQFFGIIPFNTNSTGAKVKVLSFKALHCVLVHVFIIVMLLTLIYYFVVSDEKFDYGKVVVVIFFTNCFAIALNFVFIAEKLPELIKFWSKVESEFSDGENVNRNSYKILTIFMTLAVFEHLLSKAEDYESASFCFYFYPSKFEAFSRSIIPTFFKIFPYNHALAVYVIFTCFNATVLWNFSDVFLITIYFIIFMKLKKFNRKIVKMKFRHHEKKFWIKARLNYMKIHEGIIKTNCVISCLVMLSILNDFYFVCNQILGAFK